MRAWRHSRAGHPSEVLSLTNNNPPPTINSPNLVLVRVLRAALHPGASIMMQLCIIVSTGKGVTPTRNLSPGTPVFGSIPIAAHIRMGSGALSEYLVVDADTVVHKPPIVTFEESAGLPVSGCTALALIGEARLKTGDSVLIHGASGGIGHLVLQMAKNAVGESGIVVAICSERNLEMVKALGADEVIDYNKRAPVHRYLSENYSNPRFDVVIDAFGNQELYTHCSAYLAEGKPFVTVGVAFKEYTVSSMLYTSFMMLKNMLWPRLLGGGERPYAQVAAITTQEGMEQLTRLVEDRKLKVMVDSCWDMEDVLNAYAIVLSKRARGKVVVNVQEDS